MATAPAVADLWRSPIPNNSIYLTTYQVFLLLDGGMGILDILTSEFAVA